MHLDAHLSSFGGRGQTPPLRELHAYWQLRALLLIIRIQTVVSFH